MRLHQLGIYLTGYARKPVFHRARAFGQLDAVEPGAGDVFKCKRRGDAAHRRAIFHHKLAVYAAQSEQLNFFDAGERVGVHHVNGAVGFKTFGEVATGGLAQLFAVDGFYVARVEHGHSAVEAVFRDGDLFEFDHAFYLDPKVGFAGQYLHFGGRMADILHHQRGFLRAGGQAETPGGIGHGSGFGTFPKKRGADEQLFAFVGDDAFRF
jgi:hypothetical protein